MLTYDKKHKIFVWQGPFEERHIPHDAGFEWHEKAKRWITADKYVAAASIEGRHYKDPLEIADDISVSSELQELFENSLSSYNAKCDSNLPAPLGQEYMPFQKAGIDYMVNQLIFYRNAVMCADEQGLGKTIEAIGVANVMGYRKLLVICPALARLNWEIELNRWHIHSLGVNVILKGSDPILRTHSNIFSYDLAFKAKRFRPDLIIIDEAHYLKNRYTKRSLLILGDPGRHETFDSWGRLVKARPSKSGLIASGAPTILLTGTPVPNRPIEFWNILNWTAPDIINNWNRFRFEMRFAEKVYNKNGLIVKTKPKRTRELKIRLRGSGYMLRRLKKDVLPQLSNKRYKMVIFSQTKTTAKVLLKEQDFSAKEIIAHGIPVGSGISELRREMGLAKVPQSAEYIKNLLKESPGKKFLVGAYHIDVIKQLEERLGEFNPGVIRGATPVGKRQKVINCFQSDSTTRVLIGQIRAAGTAITLTRAHDVILVEPAWLPGENDQFIDRVHRIGQTESVLVHYLVVEKSLCAKILGSAAHKKEDIEGVIN